MLRILTLLSLFSFGAVELAPAPETICVRHIEAPGYSHIAITANLQGSVVLQVTIGSDGHVIKANGTGTHRLLCDNAEKNVRLWTFSKPAQAPFVHTVVYDYKLEGPAVNFTPAPEISFDLPDRVSITTRPEVLNP
jgi:Gram-negative bacterial TonB protein C-terminal